MPPDDAEPKPAARSRILGRAPSEIRNAYKELAFEAASVLEGLLKKESLGAEHLRLIDLITKHGLGTKVEYTLSNPEVLEVVGEVAARHMSPDVYRAFRQDLEETFRDS